MKFPHCGNFNVDFLTCGNNSLTSSAKWEIKLFMFQYARGKFRAIIALKLLATDSCIQLIQYDANPTVCYEKNVVNHATFVEGFCPEIYARGRFMKYSMFA